MVRGGAGFLKEPKSVLRKWKTTSLFGATTLLYSLLVRPKSCVRKNSCSLSVYPL